MKRIIFALTIMILSGNFLVAQDKIFTKTGTINFDASGEMETITAVNKKATCVVDTKTGAMEFAVLMKAFTFEKALMEEHFNENYVESDTYPKSTFKGKIDNFSDIKFATDGTYNANISGDLTIHGVTKATTAKGTFTVKGGKVTGTSKFKVLLSDYNISIPSVVAANINKEATITVDVSLDPLN